MVLRKLMIALLGLLPIFCGATDDSALELSLVQTRQNYSISEGIEVIVSIRNNSMRTYFSQTGTPVPLEGIILPLVLPCEGPYLEFSFSGEPTTRIAEQADYIETDLDIFLLGPQEEVMQTINLDECYQLGQGRYTLHAIYDVTKRTTKCNVCDPEDIWSGVLQSQSITIEITE